MSKSLGSSLLVSLVVALGVGAAWSMAVLWVIAVVSSAVQGNQGYELLYVTLGGEPVIVRMSRAANADQEVVTLGGQPSQVDTQQIVYPQFFGGDTYQVAVSGEQWHGRLAATNDGRSPATYWYLVHDGRPGGRAYGIGYHSRTRQVAGYFGSRGFAERKPPRDEWFEFSGNTGLTGLATNITLSEPTYWSQTAGLHFIAGGKLWSVDPARRNVRPLVDCPRAQALGMAFVLPPKAPPATIGVRGNLAATNSTPQWLLLHEGDRVTLIDPQRATPQSYPLPESAQSASIAGFVLADGTLLVLTMENTVELSDAGQHKQEALWIDAQGKVVRRETVRMNWRTGGSPTDVAWAGVAASPMPLSGLATTFLIPLEIQRTGQTDSYAGALALTLWIIWPCLVALIAIGCVTAIAAYRRQKRFGLPDAALWAAFAFVLGVPGWIAYRLHRPWPVLEECPSCRQLAPRDREACTECAADFPPPPLKGIEVFA